MRVLQEINYVGGLGADRWITGGYHDAFVSLGHEHFFWTSNEPLAAKLEEVKPDILMIGCDRLTYEASPVLFAARKKGLKVLLFVDSFTLNNPMWRDIILHHDAVDVYHGETEPEWMQAFVNETGKRYVLTPNAANPKFHFPTEPVKKYQHEIVFLGAMMPNKRAALEMLLLPLRKKYDVKIYGPNWTFRDNAMRFAGLASRKAGLYGLNGWISAKRISVPVDEENQMYSSAKISVNIHERGENIKTHVILNERTFKIPACGGFELCDFLPPLRRYFTEKEVAMADDKHGDWVKDWFEKIEYYIRHDAEREAIRKQGAVRAAKDHTYKNRVEYILSIIK